MMEKPTTTVASAAAEQQRALMETLVLGPVEFGAQLLGLTKVLEELDQLRSDAEVEASFDNMPV
jgi:hypothetical protein